MTMKILALILVFASFLAGAFISVLDPRLVDWSYLVPTLVVGIVGLWLHRKAQHAETRAGDRLAENITTLENSLKNILGNLEKLHTRREDLPVYEARFEIDRLFREDLNNFAEARESMIHVFGIQNYADVMSNFAAGERYINRVWSASTDGYVDEVHAYLERARDQFREGHQHFSELLAEHSESISNYQGA
jgi:hypothetical protein